MTTVFFSLVCFIVQSESILWKKSKIMMNRQQIRCHLKRKQLQKKRRQQYELWGYNETPMEDLKILIEQSSSSSSSLTEIREQNLHCLFDKALQCVESLR